MIPAICINDGYRPKEIPKSKWLVQGQEYTVIRIARMAKMSNILGCQIMEIDLDETIGIPFNTLLSENYFVHYSG